MASRRDELRAHQFLKQRAVSALVVHQTDPNSHRSAPERRRVGQPGVGSGALAVAGVIGW